MSEHIVSYPEMFSVTYRMLTAALERRARTVSLCDGTFCPVTGSGWISTRSDQLI